MNRLAIRANARLGRDPTMTTGLRAEYEREHVRRFEELQRVITASVVENDAFRIERLSPFALQLRPSFTFRKLTPALDFGSGTPAQKAEAFQRWLDQMLRQGILEENVIAGIARAAWQQGFVQTGYLTGLKQADAKLRAAGLRIGRQRTNLISVLRQPRHREALELLFANSREDLVGITRFVLSAGTRAARQGLRAGVASKEELARQINRQVGTGIKRARILARTAIVEAHADATLNRFEEQGLEEVEAVAEFATAGDDRVCPECAGLEGEVFTVEEARGIIPVHAGCRCAWVVPAEAAGMKAASVGIAA